jgi:hypothetical protein
MHRQKNQLASCAGSGFVPLFVIAVYAIVGDCIWRRVGLNKNNQTDVDLEEARNF